MGRKHYNTCKTPEEFIFFIIIRILAFLEGFLLLIFQSFDHPKGVGSGCRVPTRTGKPGKMGRHFPVREKSGNFEKAGKVREKSGKIKLNTVKEFEINII